MNATIDLMKAHRSIRKFTERVVDDQTLQAILKDSDGPAMMNRAMAYPISKPERFVCMADCLVTEMPTISCFVVSMTSSMKGLVTMGSSIMHMKTFIVDHAPSS